jgi:hypothetical protein
MKKLKSNPSGLLFSGCLITLGVLFRTVWHIAPNVEFVTVAALLSGWYLGKKWSIAVPLFIMAISDCIIGTTSIFLFTWSAFIIVGFAGFYLNKSVVRNKYTAIKRSILSAVVAGVWFYVWTNFGVWALDSFGMYPKTLSGLISSYIMAIPFFKYNLLSNLIIVPSAFIVAEYLHEFKKYLAKQLVGTRGSGLL